MPLDPSIFNLVTPPSQQLLQGAQVGQLLTQQNQQFQQAQNQAGARQLLRTPGNVDPQTGALTDQAVQQSTRLAPELYTQIYGLRQQQREQQIQQQLQRVEFLANQADSVLSVYNNLRQQGVPESVARTSVQPLYEQSVAQARQSGLFTPQEMQGVRPVFDPGAMQQQAMQSGTIRQQYQQRQQAAATQQREQERLRMEQERLGIDRQRELRESSTANARLGLESGRLKVEQAREEREGRKESTAKTAAERQTERAERLRVQAEAKAANEYRLTHPFGPQPGEETAQQYIDKRAPEILRTLQGVTQAEKQGAKTNLTERDTRIAAVHRKAEELRAEGKKDPTAIARLETELIRKIEDEYGPQ